MDIRYLATSINIKISGIEITMLLSKDKILEKYLQVTENDTITKAKAEMVKFLNNFAKSLYLKERIDEEILDQVICFNVITSGLAISLKAIIFTNQKVEEALPEIISEGLVLEVLERIKNAYVTEWSKSVPIRGPQTIVEEIYESIYS